MIILSVVTTTTALTMSVSSSFRGEISISRRRRRDGTMVFASSSQQSSSRIISQENDDRLTVVRRAEQELTSWVDRCRRSGSSSGGLSSFSSLVVEDFDRNIIDGESAIRWGDDEEIAPTASEFENVIVALLSLPSSLVTSSTTAIEEQDEQKTDKSNRATRILDLMETQFEPPVRLYDQVIASHCVDALEGGPSGADLYKSAKSALRLINRSEELYRETGESVSRLPSISSYVAVMDVWRALAVDETKRDEALEVVKYLRQRRLRVYDPNYKDENEEDYSEYNVLPSVDIVESMTVDEVLEFGVNLLREDVPTYQFLSNTAEGKNSATSRIGTWHFNQLIFDLATHPQPFSGPLAQDLLYYMVNSVKREHWWRQSDKNIQSTTTTNRIVPKPNADTINGVLKAWMVTPRSHYPDVARRAEAVLARLATWQSEGLIWNVTATTVSYNTCINMWKECSADIPGAAQRATDILLLMEEESTKSANSAVAPDDVSYATCIGAWAECSSINSDVGNNAEAILMRMYDRNKLSDNAPRPTTRCFNAVLLAYAKNGGQRNGGGKRALELLRFMERLHAEGNTDLSPDTYTFNIVMKALANCGEKGAARKANLLLQRMEDSFTKGDSSLKPDLLSYNTVLDVFSKECDAKSAERLLQQMLAKDDAMIEPDSHSYTSVLKAWSKSSDDKAESVRRAEDILNDIESRYASGESDFRPDTSVYNALINCWAKSGEKAALFRVTEILSLMEELGLQGGDSAITPNGRTYCAVLDTHAKSKNYKAYSKSIEILDRMNAFYQEGHDSVRPCVRAYSIVLNIIARSRLKCKAIAAQELLHKMEAEYRGGNSACRPNVYSYNAVLNAAAFSGRDEGDQEDAFRVACLTFDELRMSDYLEPSDVSYGTFLKAIYHLMPESDVRDNLVTGLFRKCCRDGLLSNFVLKEMTGLATPDLYQSLLKGNTNDYGNLPKTWSCNVREQNSLQA